MICGAQSKYSGWALGIQGQKHMVLAQPPALLENMKMWPKVCGCGYTRDYLGI